jgi:hypothetical protein
MARRYLIFRSCLQREVVRGSFFTEPLDLQDLSQATARWGEQGWVFLTLWPNVVVFRGIRHGATIDILTKLGGEYDHIRSSYSEIQDKPGRWSEGITTERRPWLPPEIITGGDPSRPGQELIFTPNGRWQNFTPMRYFGPHGMWPQILVQNAEWVMKGPKQNRILPFPDLARGGDYRMLYANGGPGLVNWYREVFTSWREQRHRAIGAA